jgi:hypothetical protein
MPRSPYILTVVLNSNEKLYIIIAFLVTSCSTSVSEENPEYVLEETEATVQSNDSLDIAKVKLDSCLVTYLELDTTTELHNLYYETEKPLLDYQTQAVHVSSGDGQLGYLVLSKGDQFLLCLVDGSEGYKIIGATPIPSLKKDENFVDLCETSCQGDFLTFGVVKEISDSAVRTLMAWRINDKKRVIEQINPTAVDCNSSFYTDYD